jgi:hypothetical protein
MTTSFGSNICFPAQKYYNPMFLTISAKLGDNIGKGNEGRLVFWWYVFSEPADGERPGYRRQKNGLLSCREAMPGPVPTVTGLREYR